ncbi:MAG: zinc ribbon domain-containing protein [Chloroflexi bacterium]|nr:zinc ribbon domain-containing protein [Chloroflexota bacterium]
MPIYEYRCQDCRRKSSVLVRGFTAPSSPPCQHCDSPKTARLVSTFAIGRGSGGSLDALDEDSPPPGLEEGDPRAMARMMRQMSDEMDEPMEPDMQDMVSRMEKGEVPEEMDDLMGGGEGMNMDGGPGDAEGLSEEGF